MLLEIFCKDNLRHHPRFPSYNPEHMQEIESELPRETMDRARAWQRLTFPFPFVHHQSREEIHYPVQILVLRDKNSLENIFGIVHYHIKR